MTEPKIYLVGGAVRDRFLGHETKDIDFAVEAPSFASMLETLSTRGVRFYITIPEFVTVRGHWAIKAGAFGFEKDFEGPADFTLCRAETTYRDQRHPSLVTPTRLENDLARRDFTCNAMAVDEAGSLIDPYNGRLSLATGVLSAVGDPKERLIEDPLRILRAIRFFVTKDLKPDSRLTDSIKQLAVHLQVIPKERIREELFRCFKYDTLQTLQVLELYPHVRMIVFERDMGNVWLKPTLEAK